MPHSPMPTRPASDTYSDELVLETAARLERDELLRDRGERDHLRLGLRPDVVAVAHVHRAAVELFLADHYVTGGCQTICEQTRVGRTHRG